MKVNDIITETPLPDDWDKSKFDNKRTSFNKMITYAKERAEKLGAGSSRIAFEVQYDGRPTVIKIAKNKKGIAQNVEEIALLNDWYLEKLDVMIPIIDHDESDDPTWIHLEKADKMTLPFFKKFSGGLNFAQFIAYVIAQFGPAGRVDYLPKRINPHEEFYENFIDFYGNYQNSVEFNDFRQKNNWGVWKDRPVVIDLGLTSEVYDLHYKKK